jgi:hypothetical protein
MVAANPAASAATTLVYSTFRLFIRISSYGFAANEGWRFGAALVIDETM